MLLYKKHTYQKGVPERPVPVFLDNPKSATLARNLESMRMFLALRSPCRMGGLDAWRKRNPWETSRTICMIISPPVYRVSLRRRSYLRSELSDRR
jgi:hypothetical protein